MKLINKFKSPNFNTRRYKKISFIIIHYTALESCEKAISYLCDKKNKVSCHFLISQNGDIYNLVNLQHRAWHAGISFWNDQHDLNSISIGIELDYSFNKLNNKYSKKMINSLIILIKRIKNKYKINNLNILGHSDIAPFRKKDPGRKFPWNKLQNENISFKPKIIKNIDHNIIIRWFKKNKITSLKKISLFIFGYIGYDTFGLNNYRKSYRQLLLAYQSHYLQKNVSGKIDKVTFEFLINHFLNKLLTKS